MCDAATALLHLSSLTASSKEAAATAASSTPLEEQLQSVERAQELAWLLCDTLGSAQALMERHGRFVQVGGKAYTCHCSVSFGNSVVVQPQVTRAWRAGCSTGSAAPVQAPAHSRPTMPLLALAFVLAINGPTCLTLSRLTPPPHRPACRSCGASWHGWSRCVSSRRLGLPPAAKRGPALAPARAPLMVPRSCTQR